MLKQEGISVLPILVQGVEAINEIPYPTIESVTIIYRIIL